MTYGNRVDLHHEQQLILGSLILASGMIDKRAFQNLIGRSTTIPKGDSFVREHIFIIGFAVLGAFLIFLRSSKYGLGTTSDSAAYLAAAQNLSLGQGFTVYSGEPYRFWPPLYPVLLTLLRPLLIPVEAARLLNMLCFSAVIFVAGRWLYMRVRSSVAALGTIAILVAIPLVEVSTFAWTEILFILFVMLTLLNLEKFLFAPSARSLACITFFTTCAVLTRFIGIALIGVTAVTLLLFWQTSFRRRVGWMMVSAAFTAFPLSLWLLHTYNVSSTLLGERTPSPFSVSENLYRSLDTISAWFLPPSSLSLEPEAASLPAAMQQLLGVFTIAPAIRSALLLLGCIVVIYVLRTFTQQTNLRALLPHALFILCYLAALILSASLAEFDPIDNRLLSPIAPSLLFIVCVAVDSWRGSRLRRGHSPRYHAAFLAITLLLIVYPAIYGVASLYADVKNGVGGYTSRPWEESDFIALLKEQPLRGQLYSNRPEALYVLLELTVQKLPENRDAALAFRNKLDGDTYLLWFENLDTPALSISELERFVKLDPVASSSDGVVYRVTNPTD